MYSQLLCNSQNELINNLDILVALIFNIRVVLTVMNGLENDDHVEGVLVAVVVVLLVYNAAAAILFGSGASF